MATSKFHLVLEKHLTFPVVANTIAVINVIIGIMPDWGRSD